MEGVRSTGLQDSAQLPYLAILPVRPAHTPPSPKGNHMEIPINYKGKLAVASSWRSDYDKPIMGRVVWPSKHDWHDSYEGMTIVGQGTKDDMQFWAAFKSTGAMIWFSTPEHGEYETGAPIKQPRMKKDQQRPWTYKAGAWGRYAD